MLLEALKLGMVPFRERPRLLSTQGEAQDSCSLALTPSLGQLDNRHMRAIGYLNRS